jgi:hypothetical protein
VPVAANAGVRNKERVEIRRFCQSIRREFLRCSPVASPKSLILVHLAFGACSLLGLVVPLLLATAVSNQTQFIVQSVE